ncbi:MAG: methylenetetrahydrofolate reductase [Propionibacteriaceae bacterium]|nr:methylenetetrahydrofolate reductase [Propionibacteriaceae bacterium]
MPHIADLLKNPQHRTTSFEFFPPKNDEAQEQLQQAITGLEPLHPDFISVTYGANGSARHFTFAATEFVKRESSAVAMGHLTCVSQSVGDLKGAIASYKDIQVENILAVRGDPVGGPTAPWVKHPDGLDNATQLVELVKSQGDFCVGVAAFCDPHPETMNFELDAKLLADKQRAGAEFAITQLFFGAHKYFELVERAAKWGCDFPILPGIMPVTNVNQIERFATLSGAALPADLVERLEAVRDDPASVRAIGIEVAVDMCRELLAGGAPGLHFFTQNRSKATREIVEAL